MTATTVFEALFAAAVIAAGASLALSLAGFAGRKALIGIACGIGTAAVAAWVAFALDPGRSLAIAATGLTIATVTAVASIALEAVLSRARAADRRIAEAESQLDAHVATLLADREAELERTLARARSESLSALTEHERRLGEERRRMATQREGEATAQLADALAEVQRRVEQRLAGWTEDLERTQQGLQGRLASLTQRHEQAIKEVEVRMRTEIERLGTDSEEQRAALTRVRMELAQAADAAVASATAELEAHSGERRRALRELAERLQRREHELSQRIESEETEALRRIQGSFADIERRQIEQLSRVVERSAERFLELAGQQFDASARTAREEAAQRLSRELDRAVQTFAREAQSSLAEELARIAGAGSQRLEKRLSQITTGLERQRDEYIAGLEQRLAQTEVEFRQRVRAIAEQAEAERSVLEDRLQTLSRRADEAESTRSRR